MRAVVCGGRDFDGVGDFHIFINDLHSKEPFTEIIHGGATGADSMAGSWAARKGIKVSEFKAEWKKHGKAAGPIRNQRMLDEAKPDIVIGFPGGTGTADMLNRARKAGIPVIEAIIPAPTP